MKKVISVMIPTYNEEENVEPIAEAVIAEITSNLPWYDYEILFIDNDSTDTTRAKIRGLCKKNKKIKAIFNVKNFGQFNSPFHGLLQTTGDCTVLLCADFQDPIPMITQFVHEWENGYKIVIGIKSKSKENKIMYFLRSCYYKLIKKMSSIEQIEHFTGFGLYDKAFIDVLRGLDDPMPFLRGIVAELGFKRKDIEYQQERRRAGKTHNNWYSLYDAAMLSFTSYTKVGMRIATIMGFVLSGISIVVALMYLIMKLVFWDRFVAGMTPILLGILVFGSVQLFFIGLLGEYIMSINSRVTHRPLVVEEERINFDEKEKCIVCGNKLPETALISFEGMPASAQNIPDAEEVKSDKGVWLNLHQCSKCGLVQFDCEPVDYYRDVIRSGGFSTTMVELRRSQYKHLIDAYHLEGKKFIEVGCGQGEFLNVLTEFPVHAYGIEHREELVKLARQKGLSVTTGFTEEKDTVLGEHGPYDVFLSFNFLEHQPDPGTMLDCIWNNLTEDGMGLVTVPSLEYILQYDGYYELIRDHIAYYSFETLGNLLAFHGFEVLEEEMVNRDTCAVIVRKILKNAGKLRKFESVDVSSLAKSLDIIRDEVQKLSDTLCAEGKTLAIWGASHQGFTLAATTCLKDFAKYIIDSAPFKQGRFAPTSHLRIVPADYFHREPVDVILIVAPGYTQEISESIRTNFGKSVKIMTLRSDHIEAL